MIDGIVKVSNGFAHYFDDARNEWDARRLNWANPRHACVHATMSEAIECKQNNSEVVDVSNV